jgi:hypothetical protein
MSEEPIVSQSRRLAIAYQRVFGDAEKRTSDQKLVLADLESHCYAYRLVTEFTGAGTPSADLALFNDGRRSVWLRLRGQLIKAAAERAHPKISRKKPNP